MVFVFSYVLTLILAILLIIVISKRDKSRGAKAGGMIFFIISLTSFILTWLCSKVVEGGHPDAGMVCWLPYSPLTPYALIFENLNFFVISIMGIIINTIIGFILGYLIGGIISKNEK